MEESPGRSLPRSRTAFAVTQDCCLLSLSFNQLLKLRSESWGIDHAVSIAVQNIRKARPSLFKSQHQAIRPHMNFAHFAQSSMQEIVSVRSELAADIAQVNTRLDEIKALLQSK